MKKIISILLALVLFTSIVLLSACGGSAGVSETTEGSSASAASESATTEQPKEPVKLKIFAVDSTDPAYSYSNGLPILKEVEKRSNVSLEWELYPFAEIEKVVQTRVAAGVKLADIMDAKAGTILGFSKLKDSGLFIPLSDLIDQYAPNIKKAYEVEYPFLKKRLTMADGNIYNIALIEDTPISYFQTLFIRKDWLEKAGISKAPETTDEFYEALKAMQEKDINGNGKKDERLYALTYQLLISFQGAFGSRVATQWQQFDVDEEGKVSCPWTSIEILNTYKYLNKLYSENLIDPEILSMGFQWDKLSSKISANQVAATLHSVFQHNNRLNPLVKDFNGYYQPMNQLKGPDGKSVLIMTGPPAVDNGYYFVITKECKEPVAAVKLMDFLYSEGGRMLRNYGIEGVHYDVVNGLPVFKPEYEDSTARTAQGITFLCLPTVVKVPVEISFNTYKFTDEDKTLYNTMAKGALIPYESATPLESENKEIEAVGGDLWNYIDEMRGKFITGKESFDNWDKYVSKCKELGLDKLLVVEQKKYDRFVGK